MPRHFVTMESTSNTGSLPRSAPRSNVARRAAALVEALDDWALNTTDKAARERLLAVADAAEGQPGSLNNQVRAALARRDKPALLKLAKEARSTKHQTGDPGLARGRATRAGCVGASRRIAQDSPSKTSRATSGSTSSSRRP